MLLGWIIQMVRATFDKIVHPTIVLVFYGIRLILIDNTYKRSLNALFTVYYITCDMKTEDQLEHSFCLQITR